MDNTTIKNLIHNYLMSHGREKSVSDALPKILNAIVDNIGQGGSSTGKIIKTNTWEGQTTYLAPNEDPKVLLALYDDIFGEEATTSVGDIVEYIGDDDGVLFTEKDIVTGENIYPSDENAQWPLNTYNIAYVNLNGNNITIGFPSRDALSLMIKIQETLINDYECDPNDVYPMGVFKLTEYDYAPSFGVEEVGWGTFVIEGDTPETGLRHRIDITNAMFRGDRFINSVTVTDISNSPGPWPTGDPYIIYLTEEEANSLVTFPFEPLI